MLKRRTASTIIVILVGIIFLPQLYADDDDRSLTVTAKEMQAEKRIALIIGNGSYATAPLRNPVNDAEAMAAALQKRGFQVIKKVNLMKKEMKETVRDFGERIKGGGVGLFYYAGHGIQVDGRNYLVPIGSDAQNEGEVEFECLDTGYVLAQMQEAKNRLNIIILDACRNNPFGRGFRSNEHGLARMDAPSGSLLAYATAPGSVAADGEGKNGLYTSSLLKYLVEPGLKVEDVFKKARADVMRLSKDKQVPWETTSIVGDFFFTLPGGGSGSQLTPENIKLPDELGTNDFGDLEQRRQERMAAEKTWADWLRDRQKEYAAVKSYDQDSYLTAAEKASAWRTFSQKIRNDDPFSEDDEEMRQYARLRLDYWQNWQPTPTPQSVKPTPMPAHPGPEKQVSGGLVDNGDGTVTDTRTGLMWCQKDSFTDLRKCLTWNDANDYVKKIRTAGFDNWRLPTIEELKSIYDTSFAIPSYSKLMGAIHCSTLFAPAGPYGVGHLKKTARAVPEEWISLMVASPESSGAAASTLASVPFVAPESTICPAIPRAIITLPSVKIKVMGQENYYPHEWSEHQF